MTTPWPKVCSCGREYSREGWAKLPFGGFWELDGEVLALRHCKCKSTISIGAEHDRSILSIEQAEEIATKAARALGCEDRAEARRVLSNHTSNDKPWAECLDALRRMAREPRLETQGQAEARHL